MIAELARFSLGRVLLHLIAMLGDRAVRFHAAGIARELSWVAGATALFARIRTRLVDALALYLAQPGKRYSPPIAVDPLSLAAVLLPGDVLLTEGNTRMAALVRGITRSPSTHVSMYVGPLEAGLDPRCIVEADIAAGVRAVPLSEFNGLRVRVLRPTGLHDTDRRLLTDWVVSRIGAEYDLAHAWALATRLLRLPLASRLPPAPSTVAQGATRFICSSLLAQAFVLVGYPILPGRTGARDVRAAHYRYVTPRDFESASVFEVVRATQVG
jgi:Permuted papain-like amidase enzyme, YaeF/YiiX, C92 family